MKHATIKLWCITLTLAILAGLLITAVPVSAGNLTWDNVDVPTQLVQNVNASLFAIAPDGQTMFAFDTTSRYSVSTTLTDSVTVASTSLPVVNTTGFPASGSVIAGGQTITYTGKTLTSFNGISQPIFNLPAGTPLTASETQGTLYKSTDAGQSWTTSNIGANLPSGVVALAISPNYATDGTVIAATRTPVTIGSITTPLFRSLNGGQTFLPVVTSPVIFTPTDIVKSIDIAPYYISKGGTALLICTTNQIALYSDDVGWRSIAKTGSTPGFASPGASIVTAKFSPDYQTDAEILAVATGIDSTTLGNMPDTGGTVLETRFAHLGWNTTVRPAQLTSAATPASFIVPVSATANLAFPGDYNSSSFTSNRVYVTIGDPSHTLVPPGGYDVWRVNGSISNMGTAVNATRLKLTDQTNSNNASIAYTGTATDGTLVVGEYGTGGVWSAVSPNGTPTWTQAANPPTGQDVFLAFPPETAKGNAATCYAATNNLAGTGWGSAFASSLDYNSFKEISLIDVPDLTRISLSHYTHIIRGTQDQFIMVSYTQANSPSPVPVTAGDVQMIFKSTDGGLTWAEVFAFRDTVAGTTAVPGTVGQALNGIYPTSTYATDHTVYVPQTTQTIWKTTDGGATWNSIIATTPDNSIAAFSVISANSYWLGADSGGLYKSGSYTQIAAFDGTIPFQIFNLPFGMVINTWSGEVYLSTDNAASFIRLGSVHQFGNGRAALTFDIPGKTIYAGDQGASSPVIYKWTVGVDTAWVKWCSVAYIPTGSTETSPLPQNVAGLTLADDGTLYVRIPGVTPSGGVYPSQILRSVNLTTAPQGQQTFVGIPGTDSSSTGFGNSGNLPGGNSTIVTTDSTRKADTIYQTVGNLKSTAQNGYPFAIKSFIDILAGSPAVTAPAANEQIETSYTFKWEAILSPRQLTYQYQVATDDQFNGVVHSGNTSATTAYVSGLVQGTPYYFRVRVMLPLPSKWSDTVPLVVKLGETGQSLTGPSGNSISPGPGATNVPVKTTFQWAAVQGADSYHIQVSDNPDFASPLADATTVETFFTISSPLNPGTTYYWRIQAVNGTITSDWVSNVFTTVAPVTATPPAATTPAQAVQPTIVVTVPPAKPIPVKTPAYIWAIIAIGAVLVIAVIVLIASKYRV